KPKWYERALVFTVQGVFFNAYFLAYLASPKLAHRITGYLEEEAIHSYTEFLKELDKGNIENVKAPAIAIDYWRLPADATLHLSIDLKKHHKPTTWLDKFAYYVVKSLRLPTDIFFQRRYGCRAMMLETVAAVPGMVGGMLLHCKSLRRFEHSGGWIKALLEEAENERMHLMTFMEVAKPKWYERALVFTVQGVFFNAYFLAYLASPKLAHRITGRPPTKVWTAKLLSEREAVEMNCGGFGHGELEEDFIDEEGDPIPNNIENITKERKGFEKMFTAAEHMFPGNVNLIGFADKYMNSLKCSSEDEVELSIEKSKSMEVDDITSFSFGVTQDFDVIEVTKNENKVLTPMPISVYKPMVEASDVFMFHGKRVTTKSNIVRSPFYSRVADADAALSSEESKVAKYLFLTNHESNIDILFMLKSGQQSNRLQMESLGQDYVETNILDTWAVDKDSFSQSRNANGRFERVLQHVESVTKSTSELNKLKKIDLVFLPVDNKGHRFLLTFDLKNGAVTMFDQKKDKIVKKKKHKKGAKIGNSIVAKMLHADFGRYLYGLDHMKSRNMITTELEIGKYDRKTATVRPYAAVFLMRIMETYMGKGMRNWDLRFNSNRVKVQKQLTVLCKKYAATILMSDCNILKEQVKAHMEDASEKMDV
nr:alternative oxidase 1 [Tanacetum cinerariifolium]